MLAQANGRASSPVTTRLHLGHLTRNVTEEHIQEIFSTFGTLKSVELSIDKARPLMLVGSSAAQRMHRACERDRPPMQCTVAGLQPDKRWKSFPCLKSSGDAEHYAK